MEIVATLTDKELEALTKLVARGSEYLYTDEYFQFLQVYKTELSTFSEYNMLHHYKHHCEGDYIRIGLTKFGRDIALKHGLVNAKAF